MGAASQLEAALPTGRDLGRSRCEVVVFGGRLGDPDDRVVLAWALQAGAAVLLEPAPAAVVATAVWGRATLVHGDAHRLAALRHAVAAEREPLAARLASRLGRGVPPPRRPLGRLHSVVVTGAAPLPEADRAFWTARGVAVIPLPR